MPQNGMSLADVLGDQEDDEEIYMKKPLGFLIASALLPVVVMAQTNIDEEINAELDRLQTRPAARQESAPEVRLQQVAPAKKTRKTVEVETVSAEPIVVAQAAPQLAPQAAAPVLQNQVTQSQVVVQKQPTTYIEASPLTESKVERLRKSRMEQELQTEQKIVEKLETSRMEDEQRRADALFGDKFGNMNKRDALDSAPVSATPVVVPVQNVNSAPATQGIDKETLRGEIGAALADLNKKEEPKKDKTYFGLLAGVGDYPKAVNVDPEYSLGFAIGKRFNDRMIVEGSFIYSSFRVEQNDVGLFYYGSFYPRLTEMDQYNTALLLKYQLLDTTIRPAIGGIVSYTYRSFTDRQFAVSDQSATSHAIDLGAMIGADVELSESFSLGIEYRNMWNMTSRVDSNFQSSYQQNYLRNSTPIEKLSYYTLGIVGRASF